MDRYRLDFTGNEVEIAGVEQSIDELERMSFSLPNGTIIFLTHNFIHEMGERIQDLNGDYEDKLISESLPHYIEI